MNLLNEIDRICSENNLHYFLIGANALSAYNNHTIDNGFRMVAVAMPSDDIDIFSKIIKKDYKDRYIEKSSNEKEDPKYFLAYGDKNTTFFSLRDLDFHKQHGIIIRIYPIRKAFIKTEELEQTEGILSDMKRDVKKFLKKFMVNKDAFYVRYSIDFIRYIYRLFAGPNHNLGQKNIKSVIKEHLFNIFGRGSWATEFLISLYKHIYSAINATYFFFKNLRKHPFLEEWDDLKNHELIKIINSEVKTESLEDIGKIEVDGVDLNLPSSEFFIEVFGENYVNRDVAFKPIKATSILDTETSYKDVIKERKEYINEIKNLQREIRKTRFEVIEETRAVNNIFKLVKMTDLQIKYQRFFENHREELFSLDIENEEEFIELNNRLASIIKNLRRYSEYDMTFSIDEEADLLIKEVLLKNGEEEFVNKLEELSKLEYFIE